MHMFSAKHGGLGGYAFIGEGIPIGVGAAFQSAYKWVLAAHWHVPAHCCCGVGVGVPLAAGASESAIKQPASPPMPQRTDI